MNILDSVGTHVSMDGVYEKFEDCSETLLNRFYDLDCQLGNLVRQIEFLLLFIIKA